MTQSVAASPTSRGEAAAAAVTELATGTCPGRSALSAAGIAAGVVLSAGASAGAAIWTSAVAWMRQVGPLSTLMDDKLRPIKRLLTLVTYMLSSLKHLINVGFLTGFILGCAALKRALGLPSNNLATSLVPAPCAPPPPSHVVVCLCFVVCICFCLCCRNIHSVHRRHMCQGSMAIAPIAPKPATPPFVLKLLHLPSPPPFSPPL